MLPTSGVDLLVVVEADSSNYPGLKTEQELTANFIKWDIGYFQSCSPEECQRADKIYRTLRNGITYSVVFARYDDRGGVSPDPDYKVLEDQILSTFQFIDLSEQ